MGVGVRMSAVRAMPWVLRTLRMDANRELRTAIAELPHDLTVYFVPSPVWSTRTWRCVIKRADVTVADTAGHETPAAAFEQARAMVEYRERGAA